MVTCAHFIVLASDMRTLRMTILVPSNPGSMSSLFKVLAFFRISYVICPFTLRFFLSVGFPHVIPIRQQRLFVARSVPVPVSVSDVENGTPLWREVHLQVKMLKT